ncbi:hypothetical protein MHB75_15010 [Kurthia sp. FSL E2-0154]|uniref:hypothetical protein n=1 Tax=Kurthia sp. FSL E2-0154 TaxID=2921358 RepID=UPI0030F6156E
MNRFCTFLSDGADKNHDMVHNPARKTKSSPHEQQNDKHRNEKMKRLRRDLCINQIPK